MSCSWCTVLSGYLLLLLSACGQQVELAALTRGGLGESCETSEDCEPQLKCVELVCQSGAASVPVDAGVNLAPAAGSQGDRCRRRSDCARGLSCLREQCVKTAADLDPSIFGPSKGGPGESCAASSDCEPGFGCVDGVCNLRESTILELVNECFVVECTKPEDCCANFVPENSALCLELDTSCKQGVVGDCNLHANLCLCRRTCEESSCVANVTCTSDVDCGGSGVLKCFSGRCVQCASDQDCGGSATCLKGFCRGGCTKNEECPVLNACQDGRCVDVGCQSDRECVFAMKSPISRCEQGDCVTPCESDNQCPLPQQGCVDGSCAFVGCETDQECRVARGLADEDPRSTEQAVCREPATSASK